MTERLTTEQLEAIRKRAEAATEGPWEYIEATDDRYEMPKFEGAEYTVMSFGDCTTFYPIEGTPPDDEDAEFIAHSREDIPTLLAEVERMRKVLEFYANERHYYWDGQPVTVADDKGAIAREAIRNDSE